MLSYYVNRKSVMYVDKQLDGAHSSMHDLFLCYICEERRGKHKKEQTLDYIIYRQMNL